MILIHKKIVTDISIEWYNSITTPMGRVWTGQLDSIVQKQLRESIVVKDRYWTQVERLIERKVESYNFRKAGVNTDL